ncbi:MAG: dihydrodipicolinate synthase family protein [Alphaproteobacteria bacterium]|jgi:4-hydroxy-tetrahydrodipicolinate synthase|nr:dihydrodipicolinate synthase family protein [Alphaproteobacteria bacterium]
MATRRFRGVFAFNATPTKNDGEYIDEDRLRELADYQIDHGVHGIVVFGSTGANGSFTSEERFAAAKVAVAQVDGRVPVLCGVGSMTTAETVGLAKAAADAGVDGVLVVPITYWPLTDDEVYAHYETVAAAVDVPVCLYNNPWTTGIDMKPPLVARLAEIDNIRYIKESSSDLTRITEIRRLTNDEMTVFCGWESLTLQSLMAGADGWFSGMTNVCPTECVELFDLAVEQKDVAGARALFDRIFPLFDFMCQKSHVRVAHAALPLLGIPAGPPRRPIRELGAEDKAELERLMRACGVLDGEAGTIQAAE